MSVAAAHSRSVGVGFAAVDLAGVRSPTALVAPLALADVYTTAERRVSAAGRGVEGYAGRLAVKRAVVHALTTAGACEAPLELVEVEVLPRSEHRCFDADRCRQGHPPSVRLCAPATRVANVEVSVSHTRRIAMAVALVRR
jgi:phosphopantetheinyl transferase (holo-ACP synthase)